MERARAFGLVVFGAIVLAVFAIGLVGGFVWDDSALIVHNSKLADPDGFIEVLRIGFWDISSSKSGISETYAHVYRPVTTAALYVQRQLFGLDATGFHAVSLALHVGVSLLVFLLMLERLGSIRAAWWGAFAGALLFAVHPSRAETVAWISGSTELWMAAFVFAGYAAWVWRPRSWILPAVLFGAALFAKETAIVMPAVLLVDLHARRGAIDWKRWGALTAAFVGFVVARFVLVPPPSTGVVWDSLPRRVFATLGTYLQSTFWPWRPAIEPGFRYTDCSGALAVSMTTVALGVAAAIAIAALCFVWRRLRGQSWVADVAWFVFFLVPVLNIVPLQGYGLAAERFLYVPIFGVASLFARGVSSGVSRDMAQRAVVAVGAATLLVACAFATNRHVRNFYDTETLWAYELDRQPENLHALEMVARIEVRNDLDRGIALFQRGYARANEICNPALAARFALLATNQLVRTTNDTAQQELRALRAYYDLALRDHRLELTHPKLNLRMDLPFGYADPLLSDARLFRMPHATVTMRSMAAAEAQTMIEALLKSDPDDEVAWVLLAQTQARQGDLDAAHASVTQALRRSPGDSVAVAFARALAHAKTVASTPVYTDRDQRLQRAQLNLIIGAPEAARRELEPELERTPADPTLVLAYVRTMVADHRIDLAKEAIARAESIDPMAADWARLRSTLPPQ